MNYSFIRGKQKGKRRMRFITWAKKDPNDETPILYGFRTYDGKNLCFTSEDTVSPSFMERIRQAWIESIEKRKDPNGIEYWSVSLYEE